jgi:ribose 5-phosphate isomerase A
MATGGKDGPVVSDNGNLILDVAFSGAAGARPDWKALDAGLNALPGVVGHGLFLRYAAKSTVLVGSPSGVREIS